MKSGARAILLGLFGIGMLHAETTLEDIPTYKLGLDALEGRLWEVAANRFQAALETEGLSGEDRTTLLLRLAEAKVRGDRGAAALEILESPELADHPARPFWAAQAMAADGRFRDAVEAFGALPEDNPYPIEATLTRARLQRAIGDPKGALETLEPLLAGSKAPTAAGLLRAEILIELGSHQEALDSLGDPEKLEAGEAEATRLLRAKCLLNLDQTEAAATILSRLVEVPRYQTLEAHHEAYVHLARARLKSGNPEAAADGLLAFIQQNPDSPVLGRAFELLIRCLPEEPAPNDPILSRLREWVPAARVEGPELPGNRPGALGAWPLPNPPADPLAPQALFHLAIGLKREPVPDAPARARRLLDRLRIEYPNHSLVPWALLVRGRWELEAGNRERANACLGAIQELGPDSPPELRAQALTLEASALYNEKRYDEAGKLWERAADLLESERRRSARLNAATSLLAGGNIPAFDQLRDQAGDPDLQVQLELERSLHLASERSPEALPSLLAFVRRHPDHPRIDTARLNAALAALAAIPPQPDVAERMLGAIDPEQAASLSPSALALAEMRLHQSRNEWREAADRAAAFLKSHPDDPTAPLLRFEQGRALFSNRDFNEARLVLESVAKDFPESPQAPAALLLSARAAAEGATPQSQAESISLFDRLIQPDSPFAAVARLEKADILIRLARLDEAVETLRPWFDAMKPDDPLRLSAGMMLGDALFARASGDPERLEELLALYETLLEGLPGDSPARFRILYQKGLALESFEDRQDEALGSYMDVIQAAPESPRGDWNAIESCGFAALRILEKREKWVAAMKLARRIAQLGGPRAEEAAERAKTLGMEHFLWEK
ncbi:tetratricopeptide repeat protein [Haloferula sp. A504]|uniref:tetratricopeptide repeat protein n=1 Tax=Haloferula sp. A504 TaxID=3373601 RepID=UPI0031BF49BB|nr:tetratricopeptide repeat protein [Verrucomicrobiaceae bacterium E54]